MINPSKLQKSLESINSLVVYVYPDIYEIKKEPRESIFSNWKYYSRGKLVFELFVFF